MRLAFYFNPLPRKEGDGKLKPEQAAENHFNPLPRKEGDDALEEVLPGE